ncbi:MAG: hypothetical protein EOP04_24180 [Proteobacteria bacterium]|nr:MAG: hypothetical protein EOP04_24180 [Pseudomonadota bacterium]
MNSTMDHSQPNALVDALIKKEPDYFPAYKIKVTLLMTSGDREALDKAVVEARARGGDDIEKDELAFVSAANARDMPEVERVDREMLETNLESSSAHFYLAFALFKSGDKEGAIRELELAKKFGPYNQEAASTLKSLTEAAPGADVQFPIVTSIGFIPSEL